MPTKISLNGSDWLFKGYYGEDWRWRSAHKPGSRDHARGWKPGSVPGSVQNDLLVAGEIPDPYFERNSLLSEWVCQRTWLYRKSFQVDPDLRRQHIQLVFEGVDYDAEFFLNGDLLGEHHSMYTPAIFEVGPLLNYEEENMLAVVIAEAPHEQPQIGRSNRVRTHKARMNYWWDFSPRMVHQGIWDDVYLYANGSTHLADIFVRPRLNETLDRAALEVRTTIDSTVGGPVELLITISQGSQVLLENTFLSSVEAGSTVVETSFNLDRPLLWWPNGYGDQPLYEAAVSVSEPGSPVRHLSDRRQVTFGIREIRFVANAGAAPDAKPYTLQVNGRKIYVKGWNWVPIDTLYGVERPEKLERLLTLAKQANANLLRVWGGGLIEKEAFYNLCDHCGILVWQEFIQSSSGIANDPPGDPEFIQVMVGEARRIIPRRRNHPSLAIWCGGNELYSPERPLDDDHPMLAALKKVVQELDPDRHWLPTSASGPVINNSLEEIKKDPTKLHDVHGPWEYQGMEKQYTLYNQGSSLYHSEFGVEGITNLRTLNLVIDISHQQPMTLDNPYWFHTGAWWVWPQVWSSIFGDFKDISEEVRMVQFLQFEGLRYAVEADRRRWPHNSGTSPWQFNEPFPNASCTSAVDYFAEPKPAYYAVARAYNPLTITARYPRLVWNGYQAFEAELWAGHDGSFSIPQVRLAYRLLGWDGKEYLAQELPVDVPENLSTRLEAVSFPLDNLPQDLFLLDLAIKDEPGNILASNRYIFSQGENLAALRDLPQTRLDFQTELLGTGEEADWQVNILNTGPYTAMYVLLETDHNLHKPGWALFSDNYFCLLPGEKRTVAVHWQGIDPADCNLTAGGWNTGHTEILK